MSEHGLSCSYRIGSRAKYEDEGCSSMYRKTIMSFTLDTLVNPARVAGVPCTMMMKGF